MKCLSKYVHRITEVRIPISSPIQDWQLYRNDIAHDTSTIQHEPGLEILMSHGNAKKLDYDLRELNCLQSERYMDKLALSRELDLRLRVPAVAAAWDHYQLMLKLAG
jgi:hypothetical protein